MCYALICIIKLKGWCPKHPRSKMIALSGIFSDSFIRWYAQCEGGRGGYNGYIIIPVIYRLCVVAINHVYMIPNRRMKNGCFTICMGTRRSPIISNHFHSRISLWYVKLTKLPRKSRLQLLEKEAGSSSTVHKPPPDPLAYSPMQAVYKVYI